VSAEQDRVLLGTGGSKDEVFRLAKERVGELGGEWSAIEPRELHLDVIRTKTGDAYRLWIERSVLDRDLSED